MQQDDAQLLEDFATRLSQEAFAQLSRRYVNLVYSSALRQMGDVHAAEDVTQAVFIILAQKARGLGRGVVLPSWLLQTTAYAVKNAKRAQSRRRYHEQEAAQMKPTIESDEGAGLWEQMTPAIDAAVGSLSAAYRDAVVLRFFDQQSYEEVARRLKISEPAARQRISRAVAELRKILAKQGAIGPAVGAGLVAGALEANALASAPASLAAACAAVAGASQSVPWLIAKGVMTMLLLKKMAVGALVLMLLTGVGVVVATQAQKAPQPIEAAGKGGAAAAQTARRPVIEGTVMGTDGKPLPGAHVYLADPDHPVTVYGDQQPPRAWFEAPGGFPGLTGYDQKPANRLWTVSDGAGRFRFEAAAVKGFGPEDWAVLVASAQGFAHGWPDDLKAAGGKIQLAAWGQIEGTLRSEGKVVPNAVVQLARLAQIRDSYPFMVQYEDESRTDEQGNFKFDMVAPGDTWLIHAKFGDMRPGNQAAYVRVEAGKTHEVQVGGKGRPVIGQLVEPPGAKEKLIWMDRYHYTGGSMRIEPYPTMVEPANWHQLSAGQKAALRAKWSETPEGRIYNEHLFHILVDAKADGSFRIPEVPPGKYRLNISSQHGFNAGALAATLSMVVEVPPMAQDWTPEPLDLGKLSVQMEDRMVVGEVAPEFEVERLDGNGQIRSADYKGKLVLLQLWPTRMEAASLELKYIQRARALAGEDKLAVISIGLGADREQMRKTAQEGGMNWTLGAAEVGSKVMRDYKVRAYGVFLIGPDGKVLGRQLSDREIVPAVQNALAEMTSK